MGAFLQENPRIHRLRAETRMEDVSYLEPMKSYFVLTSLRRQGKGVVVGICIVVIYAFVNFCVRVLFYLHGKYCVYKAASSS